AHRVYRGRRDDPARADAGVLRDENHLHHQRERTGTDLRRAGRGWNTAGAARDGGRRFRRTPLARTAAFRRRSQLAARARLVVDRTSPDFKRRTSLLADIAGGEPKVLHEIVEEKFWSMTGDANSGAQPSPDGQWIAFLSDRDGWDHLYVMPAPDVARRLQPSE